MSNKKLSNCRQCKSPVLEGSDGIIIGREQAKGWCDICIGKSLFLMAGIAKVATEDMEFDDFLKSISGKCQTYHSSRFTGKVCPSCGNGMLSGSCFSSCKKCFPEHFQPCQECGQLKISCICGWEDQIL